MVQKKSISDARSAITSERKRTNILRNAEYQSIAFLVRLIPSWISSNTLTAIGFFGNFLVFLSFVLAKYLNPYFLLLGVFGFAISWFGDSLDGRIAYYRNIPRKWYGFSLDITVDWIGTIFIGLGFMAYVDHPWTFIGFGFIVLYGWEMITVILRYKITGKHSIDSGLLGPTEVRIIIALVMLIELFIAGSIIYFGIIAVIVLLIVNVIDFNKLLDLANIKDREEKEKSKKHVE